MNEVTIEKKKYVILLKDEYEALRKRAAKKIYKQEKRLTIAGARVQTKRLIRQWAGVK